MTPNRNKWVSLFRVPSENSTGGLQPLEPANDWVSIQPVAPGNSGSDGRVVTSLVSVRYRSDVSIDTMLRYTVNGVDRDFFVRGVQHVDEAQAELRLLCEEIV